MTIPIEETQSEVRTVSGSSNGWSNSTTQTLVASEPASDLSQTSKASSTRSLSNKLKDALLLLKRRFIVKNVQGYHDKKWLLPNGPCREQHVGVAGSSAGHPHELRLKELKAIRGQPLTYQGYRIQLRELVRQYRCRSEELSFTIEAIGGLIQGPHRHDMLLAPRLGFFYYQLRDLESLVIKRPARAMDPERTCQTLMLLEELEYITTDLGRYWKQLRDLLSGDDLAGSVAILNHLRPEAIRLGKRLTFGLNLLVEEIGRLRSRRKPA